MFNAFDVLDVIQTFHMLGFKKFNFQTYFFQNVTGDFGAKSIVINETLMTKITTYI